MKGAVLLFFCAILFQLSNAQKKLVIMGSSTAEGNGASNYNNSWAGKVTSFYNQNTSDGIDTTVTNIALGGLTTYQEMPTDFVPPTGRPAPDPNRNVNKALSYSPDVIIINLPTNDMASGFTKVEFMNNLRAMYQRITTAGVRCYITTSQPRTNLGTEWRDSLKTLKDSIINNFGLYAVDFWTDLVSSDGQNNIAAAYNSGDNVHVNDAGHNLLYIRVRDKSIFSTITLPVRLYNFYATAQNNDIVLQWKTEDESQDVTYEVQKISSANNYITIGTLTRQSNNPVYKFTDRNPVGGTNYYRIKINEAGTVTYSNVVTIHYQKPLAVNSIYHINKNTLGIKLQPADEKAAAFIITASNGVVLKKQLSQLNPGTNTINLPVENLSRGTYFLTVQTQNKTITKAFVH